MSHRSIDDYAYERQTVDAAHAQNESGRDAFAALAHTALFAASVSFVGDVAPLDKAIWKPVLILGWSADVVGLLALTSSFSAARRMIDARRAALNDADPPASRLAEILNSIALWSFPVALLCLFSFVTANVVNLDGRETKPPGSAERRVRGGTAGKVSVLPRERLDAPSASTNPWRAVQTLDWCHSSAASASSATLPCARSLASEGINPVDAGQPGAR